MKVVRIARLLALAIQKVRNLLVTSCRIVMEIKTMASVRLNESIKRFGRWEGLLSSSRNGCRATTSSKTVTPTERHIVSASYHHNRASKATLCGGTGNSQKLAHSDRLLVHFSEGEDLGIKVG